MAWKIATRADVVRARLAQSGRPSFSLRQVAQLLGVSTQPVRDWLRFGYLQCDGRGGRISRGELDRFLSWLESRAEPFPVEGYTERFIRRTRRDPFPFQKLAAARFQWPKGRKALSPKELAALVGCHPSLIVKAIQQSWLKLGSRRTRCRWEISRYAWSNRYPGTLVVRQRTPPIPAIPLFSIPAAAGVITRWGILGMTPRKVRRMIRAGELEALPPRPGVRLWQVPRKSLEKLRSTLLTRETG